MDFQFRRTSPQEALAIASWEYPPPYDVYNLGGASSAVAKLASGRYFSVLRQNTLVGYFCYGPAGQFGIASGHGLYKDRMYLDVGLGLHPDFCDQGLGGDFVRAGLQYAADQGWAGGYRLTVAAENRRALKVYGKVGFQETGRFKWRCPLGNEFLVLTREKILPTPVIDSPR